MSSMYHRHGIFTHMMAMVLVFTMPLCCCIVKTATGAPSSCCATEVAVTIVDDTSCCQKQKTSCVAEEKTDDGSENVPCDGDCGCTIKGAVATPQWTAPIDIIGANTPAPFFATLDLFSNDQRIMAVSHGPPVPNISKIGYSNAPPLRGAIILQV